MAVKQQQTQKPQQDEATQQDSTNQKTDDRSLEDPLFEELTDPLANATEAEVATDDSQGPPSENALELFDAFRDLLSPEDDLLVEDDLTDSSTAVGDGLAAAFASSPEQPDQPKTPDRSSEAEDTALTDTQDDETNTAEENADSEQALASDEVEPLASEHRTAETETIEDAGAEDETIGSTTAEETTDSTESAPEALKEPAPVQDDGALETDAVEEGNDRTVDEVGRLDPEEDTASAQEAEDVADIQMAEKEADSREEPAPVQEDGALETDAVEEPTRDEESPVEDLKPIATEADTAGTETIEPETSDTDNEPEALKEPATVPDDGALETDAVEDVNDRTVDEVRRLDPEEDTAPVQEAEDVADIQMAEEETDSMEKPAPELDDGALETVAVEEPARDEGSPVDERRPIATEADTADTETIEPETSDTDNEPAALKEPAPEQDDGALETDTVEEGNDRTVDEVGLLDPEEDTASAQEAEDVADIQMAEEEADALETEGAEEVREGTAAPGALEAPERSLDGQPEDVDTAEEILETEPLRDEREDTSTVDAQRHAVEEPPQAPGPAQDDEASPAEAIEEDAGTEERTETDDAAEGDLVDEVAGPQLDTGEESRAAPEGDAPQAVEDARPDEGARAPAAVAEHAPTADLPAEQQDLSRDTDDTGPTAEVAPAETEEAALSQQAEPTDYSDDVEEAPEEGVAGSDSVDSGIAAASADPSKDSPGDDDRTRPPQSDDSIAAEQGRTDPEELVSAVLEEDTADAQKAPEPKPDEAAPDAIDADADALEEPKDVGDDPIDTSPDGALVDDARQAPDDDQRSTQDEPKTTEETETTPGSDTASEESADGEVRSADETKPSDPEGDKTVTDVTESEPSSNAQEAPEVQDVTETAQDDGALETDTVEEPPEDVADDVDPTAPEEDTPDTDTAERRPEDVPEVLEEPAPTPDDGVLETSPVEDGPEDRAEPSATEEDKTGTRPIQRVEGVEAVQAVEEVTEALDVSEGPQDSDQASVVEDLPKETDEVELDALEADAADTEEAPEVQKEPEPTLGDGVLETEDDRTDDAKEVDSNPPGEDTEPLQEDAAALETEGEPQALETGVAEERAREEAEPDAPGKDAAPVQAGTDGLETERETEAVEPEGGDDLREEAGREEEQERAEEEEEVVTEVERDGRAGGTAASGQAGAENAEEANVTKEMAEAETDRAEPSQEAAAEVAAGDVGPIDSGADAPPMVELSAELLEVISVDEDSAAPVAEAPQAAAATVEVVSEEGPDESEVADSVAVDEGIAAGTAAPDPPGDRGPSGRQPGGADELDESEEAEEDTTEGAVAAAGGVAAAASGPPPDRPERSTQASAAEAIARTPSAVHDLKRGAEGELVVVLQTVLRDAGYHSNTLNGIFGDETQAALVEFQVENDLEPHGVVDAETELALAPQGLLALLGAKIEEEPEPEGMVTDTSASAAGDDGPDQATLTREDHLSQGRQRQDDGFDWRMFDEPVSAYIAASVGADVLEEAGADRLSGILQDSGKEAEQALCVGDALQWRRRGDFANNLRRFAENHPLQESEAPLVETLPAEQWPALSRVVAGSVGEPFAEATRDGRLRLPDGIELDPVDGAKLIGVLSLQGEAWLQAQRDHGATWLHNAEEAFQKQRNSRPAPALFGDSIKDLW